MSRVSELIDLIVQGKNSEASDVLNQELLQRSYQAITDIKPHIASQYFAPLTGEEEAQAEPQEEPTNEAD